MYVRGISRGQEDLMVSMLRSHVDLLMGMIQYIESGNHINSYVNENIKHVEKELHWLRGHVLTNDE